MSAFEAIARVTGYLLQVVSQRPTSVCLVASQVQDLRKVDARVYLDGIIDDVSLDCLLNGLVKKNLWPGANLHHPIVIYVSK